MVRLFVSLSATDFTIIFLGINIGITNTYLCSYIPMLLYWILIAAANAATYQPALVAIRLKPVEQAQEKVVVAQVRE